MPSGLPGQRPVASINRARRRRDGIDRRHAVSETMVPQRPTKDCGDVTCSFIPVWSDRHLPGTRIFSRPTPSQTPRPWRRARRRPARCRPARPTPRRERIDERHELGRIVAGGEEFPGQAAPRRVRQQRDQRRAAESGMPFDLGPRRPPLAGGDHGEPGPFGHEPGAARAAPGGAGRLAVRPLDAGPCDLGESRRPGRDHFERAAERAATEAPDARAYFCRSDRRGRSSASRVRHRRRFEYRTSDTT
jgi:hypothetical protein